MAEKLTYSTRLCADVDDATLKQCSDLFSNHYGVYSGKDGRNPKGKQIKLGINYYKQLREKKDMYVSLCFSGEELIGQAFFLKKSVLDDRVCTWVIQLLVNKYYRGRGIATKLLHSAWGFSDYFAWGLATANAVTIKTLESVTWRKVDPFYVAENIDAISAMCDDITFVKSKKWEVSEKMSQIFTDFYPEPEKIDPSITNLYVGRLGQLKDGNEWLAFTFQTQPMELDEAHLELLLDFSSEQLNDAYGRMEMASHTWTSHTGHEIDYVLETAAIKPGDRVLDLGSGIGRHTLELARRGMKVVAVEPTPSLQKQARVSACNQLSSREIDNILFLDVDGRKKQLIPGKFDCIICLYDVIGSFRRKEENVEIIDTIASKLKPDGVAVVSIMNMDLTKSIATNRGNVYKEPQKLLQLRPSNIMQRTGNVFNPDYFLLDEEHSLVYRKEQFDSDDNLSTEYVIADYRFTKDEFIHECECRNLQVLDARYVQLGKWSLSLDKDDIKAKEILFVLKKISENS
ncbi:MAG: class I SAM-dependent methyltransferase [Bacteroidales bacterium]|nr:class I SAM-dependent methyltransferase [Bacteroidales bacterium]